MAESESYAVVTVLSGQQDSPEVQVPNRFLAVGILSPATLAEVTTVEVAERTGGTFRTLQETDLSADFTLTAAKAAVIPDMPFRTFRIHLGGAAGADRVFHVVMKMKGV